MLIMANWTSMSEVAAPGSMFAATRTKSRKIGSCLLGKLVELKSVEQLARVHKKQLLTYLRLTNCRLGLVINFGEDMIGDGIARVANGLPSE
jgi:hypothetical protein